MAPRVGGDAETFGSGQVGLTLKAHRASAVPPQPSVRWAWVAGAAVVMAAVVVAAVAAGWDVGGWLGEVWESLTSVSLFVLAAVLVAAAFGRSGGKRLVEESSAQARELQAEPRE
jgi:hypothetical protein